MKKIEIIENDDGTVDIKRYQMVESNWVESGEEKVDSTVPLYMRALQSNVKEVRLKQKKV